MEKVGQDEADGAGWESFEPFLWRVTDISEDLRNLASALDHFYKRYLLVDGGKLSENQRKSEKDTDSINDAEREGDASLKLSNFAYGEIVFDTFFEFSIKQDCEVLEGRLKDFSRFGFGHWQSGHRCSHGIPF